MESHAKLLGHPIHPMLIVLPLGLLAGALIFDIVHLATGGPRFADVSYWMIVGGVGGGLLAAIPGFVDYLAIPSGTRAKSIGAYHGVMNVVIMALAGASWYLRSDDPTNPGAAAFATLWLGVGLALPSGWLGGELVDRLGVGVDDGAHLNSPSALGHRPATEVSEGRTAAYPAATRADVAGRRAMGVDRSGKLGTDTDVPTVPSPTSRPGDRQSPGM